MTRQNARANHTLTNKTNNKQKTFKYKNTKTQELTKYSTTDAKTEKDTRAIFAVGAVGRLFATQGTVESCVVSSLFRCSCHICAVAKTGSETCCCLGAWCHKKDIINLARA